MNINKKKARIAEVKALHLSVGEWVGRGRGPIFRVQKYHLDARSIDFGYLRRATAEEIADRLAADEKREKQRVAMEAERNRPEYKLASRFSSTDTDEYLKLSVSALEQIARILDKEGI